MPSRRASFGVNVATLRPSAKILPLSGCSVPDSRLINVLLPAPFSPSKAWMRPGSRSIDTSRSTLFPKNALETPRAPSTN
jgi:hypothetical protein